MRRSIVNVASILGQVGFATACAYFSAKHTGGYHPVDGGCLAR